MVRAKQRLSVCLRHDGGSLMHLPGYPSTICRHRALTGETLPIAIGGALTPMLRWSLGHRLLPQEHHVVHQLLNSGCQNRAKLTLIMMTAGW